VSIRRVFGQYGREARYEEMSRPLLNFRTE
jgi:hypothetical protein